MDQVCFDTRMKTFHFEKLSLNISLKFIVYYMTDVCFA